MIARYQFKHDTMKFIDVLPQLLTGYNSSWHRTIKMAPNQVSADNEHIVYENVYGSRQPPPKKPFIFKIGDNVRIATKRAPWAREFHARWSEEIFNVSRRYYQKNIAMYRISDCAGEEVIGSFYTEELKRVIGDPKDKFRIEQVIDEKTKNKKKFVLVKFRAYPESCNEWVLKSSIRNVK